MDDDASTAATAVDDDDFQMDKTNNKSNQNQTEISQIKLNRTKIK